MIDYEDYGCNSGEYPSHNSADDPSHYSGFERALAIFSEIVLHFLVGAFFLIVEKTYMFVDLPISIDNIKIIWCLGLILNPQSFKKSMLTTLITIFIDATILKHYFEQDHHSIEHWTVCQWVLVLFDVDMLTIRYKLTQLLIYAHHVLLSE